ncbi:MAG: N-acetylmuramoyl-L-alanine amidase [Fimbriimonadaceae bacterium]|nr:N-acetylmuramoyl-L-alanine amidase [Fimbriimonadaceae bacterium]QYK55046.1 MAG: N-acetylmuramoyl-L-alanine amidase [Fimbriimonadaceae bacterium]
MVACAILAALLGASPKPVVCLDPGHPSEVGRGASGKRVTELEVAWKVALKLRPLLEKGGYTVVLTKSSQGQKMTNRRRAQIANEAKADLMLRLHLDAAKESGLATFYPAREGRAQGVTGPSKAVREASKRLAPVFHKAVMESLKGKLKDRGVRDEGQTTVGGKQGALTGSIFSKVPVLLVEMAVITNPNDEKFVATNAGQNALAEALKAGVDAALAKVRAGSKEPGSSGRKGTARFEHLGTIADGDDRSEDAFGVSND